MNIHPRLANLMPHIIPGYFGALPNKLHYHNLEHTQRVAELALQLGQRAAISQQELDCLYAAAVLHDTGYTKAYQNNEGYGANHAQKELPAFGFEQSQIDVVTQLIKATSFAKKPKTYLEKLIKDADLGYLGLPDFLKWSNLLYKEYTAIAAISYGAGQWLTNQVEFLSQHRFYTKEGIALFEAGKQENLKRLRSLSEWPF